MTILPSRQDGLILTSDNGTLSEVGGMLSETMRELLDERDTSSAREVAHFAALETDSGDDAKLLLEAFGLHNQNETVEQTQDRIASMSDQEIREALQDRP